MAARSEIDFAGVVVPRTFWISNDDFMLRRPTSSRSNVKRSYGCPEISECNEFSEFGQIGLECQSGPILSVSAFRHGRGCAFPVKVLDDGSHLADSEGKIDLYEFLD